MNDARVIAAMRDPAFYADPYALYAELRARDPVMYIEQRGGTWFFTSYAAVAAGLKLPELSNARAGHFLQGMPPEQRVEFEPLVETISRWLLYYDPPRHTRIRKLMGKAFSYAAVNSLQPRIEQITAEILDAAQPAGRMDVLHDLAFELPIRVIGELLGVPPDRRADFIAWSGDIGRLLGGAAPTVELARSAARAVRDLTEYLRGQVEVRRQRPADDILTLLITAEEDGETLTEDELYAQCVLLLFAGHETTRNLIANGLLALLRNPDEFARLRDDPSLVKTAVEELLRYDSPVQMISRMVRHDFEYAGRRLRKGQFATMFLGAANRDPAQFTAPDRLDITRKDNRHLALAIGPHACLGAQLARLEAAAAFTALLARMPDMRLADECPTYVPNLKLRGLTSLPILF